MEFSSKTQYSCPVPKCSKRFTRPENRNRHYNAVHCDIAAKPALLRRCPYAWCSYSTPRVPNFQRHQKTQHGGPNGRKVNCKVRKARALAAADEKRPRSSKRTKSVTGPTSEWLKNTHVKPESEGEHSEPSPLPDVYRFPNIKHEQSEFRQSELEWYNKEFEVEQNSRHESAGQLIGASDWSIISIFERHLYHQQAMNAAEQARHIEQGIPATDHQEITGPTWAMRSNKGCSTLASSASQSPRHERSMVFGLHNWENEHFSWMEWDRFDISDGNYDWELEKWPLDMAALSVVE